MDFSARIRDPLTDQIVEGTMFTPEQVQALCGGKFPYGGGFLWDTAEYFLLETEDLESGNIILEPYAGASILPGPGILITAKAERLA